jgi:hypothetical protein
MMNYREPCGNVKEKTGNISHVHGHERFDIKNDELRRTMWGTYKRKKKKRGEKVRGDFSQFGGKCIPFGCSHNPTSAEKNSQNWIDIYVLSFKAMAIMTSCFFTHLNVKEFKLKIHLIKF